MSAASDMYSVGVILYELLTGAVPFEGETAVAIAFKQVSAEPPPPSAVNPALPVALDAVVLRALAKDPRERYADAEEFIAALAARAAERCPCPRAHARRPAPRRRGAGANPPRTGPLLLPAAIPPRCEDGRRHGRTRRRRRVLLWVGGRRSSPRGGARAPAAPGIAGRSGCPNVVGQTRTGGVARAAARRARPRSRCRARARLSPRAWCSADAAGGHVVAKGLPRDDIGLQRPRQRPAGERRRADRGAGRGHAARGRASSRRHRSAAERDVAEGCVIATEPSAGTEVPVGSPVTVLVSSGPAPVHVPDILGQSRAAAEADAHERGPRRRHRSPSRSPPDRRRAPCSRSPRRAARSLHAGGKVNLERGAGVRGNRPSRTWWGRTRRRRPPRSVGAGFAPKTVPATTTEPAQVGLVLKQSPAAGTQRAQGRHGDDHGRRAGRADHADHATTPTTTPTTPRPRPPTPTTPPPAAPAG